MGREDTDCLRIDLKILFYNHTGHVSGAERVLMMTLAALDRSSFEPLVLCPADGRLIQSINDLRIKAVGMDPLAARFTWRPDRLIRYFASFARVIPLARAARSEEHTSELQSRFDLVCRLLLE